jgi:hypothetical protein
MGVDAGTASIFSRNAGTQKSWITSSDWTVKLICCPRGHVELRRGELLARLVPCNRRSR